MKQIDIFLKYTVNIARALIGLFAIIVVGLVAGKLVPPMMGVIVMLIFLVKLILLNIAERYFRRIKEQEGV